MHLKVPRAAGLQASVGVWCRLKVAAYIAWDLVVGRKCKVQFVVINDLKRFRIWTC
jgi:hypothetical protein